MDMQMTIENSVFTRPFFLFGAPERTEAHVDHAGAAALPLKASGRMEFNMTRPEDFRIGTDGNFPEIKQSGSRKTGILRALALFQQIAPSIAVSCATPDLDNLSSLQLDFNLRKRSRKMTGGPGDHTRGALCGDDWRHRMAEKMTIARRRGKPITRTVIVFIPIGPRNIGPFRIR